MWTATVIYLLPLILHSLHARVATLDDKLPDITSNSVIDDVKKQNDSLIVDLLTIRPIETTTLIPQTENYTDINDNTIDSKCTCDCKCGEHKREPLILSKYIKDNRLAEGRNASRVKADLFMGVESYSGYITVNETYNSNMFFWYFPVEKKSGENTPWIIWLQGGPGASSMTGLFDEIGPFHYTDGKLVRNKYSWLQNHSLLFIDNPVGTGFSFTYDEKGYATDMDTYGDHLYIVVDQFLTLFPELRTRPLYVAGESYAGKYVPALAIRLHRNKELKGHENNLQGLITGNAYTEPALLSQPARAFYNFGMLQTEQLDVLRPLMDAFDKHVRDKDSVNAKIKWSYLIHALIIMSNQRHAYNFLSDEFKFGFYKPFLNKPEVKSALHVNDHEFESVNTTVTQRLDGDFLSSARPLYEELLEHYRVLAYCGQLDQMLPCVASSENYRTWRWSAADKFRNATRYSYMYKQMKAGYHKTGGNLTEVMFRGAGHMVPMDAPAPSHALVTTWTHHLPLTPFGIGAGFIEQLVRNHTSPLYL